MNTSLYDDAQRRRGVGRKVVCWKLTTFLFLAVVLLALQYPIGQSYIPKAWEYVVMVLLVHSVVMLADALCELFDRKRPHWADTPLGFLLPVEPRGFPQLITLLGLLGAVAIAMGIRGCAELSTLVPE